MSQVAQLEQQLVEAKELVERRQMAMRLAKNADFRKLIMDSYCGTEAARLVQLSADPVLSDREKADALNMAQATGHFKRFMSMAIQMGAHAEGDMTNLEESIAEARVEEQMEEAGEAIN